VRLCTSCLLRHGGRRHEHDKANSTATCGRGVFGGRQGREFAPDRRRSPRGSHASGPAGSRIVHVRCGFDFHLGSICKGSVEPGKRRPGRSSGSRTRCCVRRTLCAPPRAGQSRHMPVDAHHSLPRLATLRGRCRIIRGRMRPSRDSRPDRQPALIASAAQQVTAKPMAAPPTTSVT
jgi:hypothetical protein